MLTALGFDRAPPGSARRQLQNEPNYCVECPGLANAKRVAKRPAVTEFEHIVVARPYDMTCVCAKRL
jgi:hypothetical protein